MIKQKIHCFITRSRFINPANDFKSQQKSCKVTSYIFKKTAVFINSSNCLLILIRIKKNDTNRYVDRTNNMTSSKHIAIAVPNKRT